MAEDIKKSFPLVPLRGLTVFPNMVLHFDAGRDKSVSALEVAMLSDQVCVLVTQKDARTNDTGRDDIYGVGVAARIKQILKLPGQSVRVLVEGLFRVRIIDFTENESYSEVMCVEMSEQEMDADHSEAIMRRLTDAFERYNRTNGKITAELLVALMEEKNSSKLIDIIAANVLVNVEDKQAILAEPSVWERAQMLLTFLARETEIKKLEVQIQNDVHKAVEKNQKEYYLREQLKVIRGELGESDSPQAEADELMERLEELELNDETRAKVQKEIRRYSTYQSGSPEAPMLRGWLDWIFDLPWGVYTTDSFDIDNAREILDADHYGLEKVKERIIEQLSVCKLKNSAKGTILCLVGPPGVGKTSVAASIARAVGRNYVRMSLGGVSDEAEIRGHRRTYIGSMPGRIITAMKQAKSMNPLILLDEIDKMNATAKGDPASAMLEVLDSAQNFAFRDHYLEVPFDLSNVMFVMTANTLETIPRPLLDRMEVVELNSYTEGEKLEIAKQHLVEKQRVEHGLSKSMLKVTDDAILDLINLYTREAGVRNLERRIADICRKLAVQTLEGKKRFTLTSRQVAKLLGAPKYKRERLESGDKVGVANGLAWTAVGGEVLTVEVALIKGSGKLELTGQLGDVMKESAQAGFTFLRANCDKVGIDPEVFAKTDVHIHVPAGATPKDGPSAGITMATAMISAFTGIPIRSNVAMTGEITLRGRVLPIGGLKEKSIAAQREGITKILIPRDNAGDVEQIPENVREQLEIVPVDSMDAVLEGALCASPAALKPVPAAQTESGEAIPERLN